MSRKILKDVLFVYSFFKLALQLASSRVFTTSLRSFFQHFRAISGDMTTVHRKRFRFSLCADFFSCGKR